MVKQYLCQLLPVSTDICSHSTPNFIINGRPIVNGLWAHPPRSNSQSKISYDLQSLQKCIGKILKLEGSAGIVDGATPKSEVTFQILGDGEILWQSTTTPNYEINLSNIKCLDLISKCDGDFGDCWALWIDPMITSDGSIDIPNSRYTPSTQIISICSSRMRPNRLKETIESFLQTSTANTKLFVYVDEEDKFLQTYKQLFFENKNIDYEIGSYKNLVQVINYGFHKYYHCNYFHEVNDDHIFRTKNWDILLKEAIDSNHGWGISYGNTENLPSAVMMSGKLAKTLNYFMYPKFVHTYVDNYIIELGKSINGLLFVPEVTIEHMHMWFKKAPNDANYAWVYSEEQTTNGKIAYQEWTKEKHKIISQVSEAIKVDEL